MTGYRVSVGYDSGATSKKGVLENLNLYYFALGVLRERKHELKNFLAVEYGVNGDDVDAYFNSEAAICKDDDDVLVFRMNACGGGEDRRTQEIIAYQFLLFLAAYLFRNLGLTLNIRVS